MSRIELAAGGFGFGGISSLQTDFSGLVAKSENVIASFAVVKSKTSNISGGVGNLKTALDDIGSRIAEEEKTKSNIQDIQKKTDEFVELTVQKDKQAAEIVKNNQEEFFRKFPELKPADTQDEQAWYEEAWDWLCGKGEEIVEGVKAAFDWTKDTLKKAWNGIVAFYQEHKKIIDTILIVVCAIAAIVGVLAAGPAALVLLLTTLGVSASLAATISAVVFAAALISTTLAAIVNICDVWCEIDNKFFNFIQTSLNIISGITTFAIDVGAFYKAIKSAPKILIKDSGSRAVDTFDSMGNEIKVASDFFPGADERIDRVLNINKRKFYSVTNSNGGKIHVSVNTIKVDTWDDYSEITNIIVNADGKVNILSGTHGGIDGFFGDIDKSFYLNDIKRWGDLPNVKVINVRELTPEALKNIVNSSDTTICAWCFSERSFDILHALGVK